jgi:hypothetical protein
MRKSSNHEENKEDRAKQVRASSSSTNSIAHNSTHIKGPALISCSNYAEFAGHRVYRKEDVAQLFQCTIRTLDNYIALGRIKARRIGMGRFQVAFFEKDILQFMEAK